MAILVLSAISIYYALAITGTTKGAPRGWYVIIIAFVALFLFRAVELYYDVQSSSDIIDDAEAAISVVVGLLFVLGLLMLNRSFRRQLESAQTA